MNLLINTNFEDALIASVTDLPDFDSQKKIWQVLVSL